MSSKVEELRHKLHVDVTKDIEGVASAWGDSEYITERKIQGFRSDLDSLISAARSEGVAEGAEEMKAEIRKRSEHYHGDPCVEGGSYYVVLDAVLAPTKESEK